MASTSNCLKTMSFKNDDFSGLLNFEELTDYNVITGDSTENAFVNSKNVKDRQNKTKKKKRKKKPNGQTESVKKENNMTVDKDKMVDWHPFGLPEEVLLALARNKFFTPTPIQARCIPAGLEMKDILGAAETGSGKTLAFAIPIVCHLLRSYSAAASNTSSSDVEPNRKKFKMDSKEESKLRCLIVTPTRELAIQIKEHIQNLLHFAPRLNVLELVGGLSVEKQSRKLEQMQPEIVVGTAGRIWHFIHHSTHPHFHRIAHTLRYLVIDEADRMLEKAHFEELNELLEHLKLADDSRNKKRQTFLFSATLTFVGKFGWTKHSKNGKDIDKMAELMRRMALSKNSTVVIDLSKPRVLASTIKEYKVECASGDERDEYLFYLLKFSAQQHGQRPSRTVVFCNSVESVKRLLGLLKHLNLQNVRHLFADMGQKQRLDNLDKFEKEDNSILVATEVAGRGLDLNNVTRVIHYHLPKTVESYVHRSGRTGRTAATEGVSIMLCTPQDYHFYKKIVSNLNKGDKNCKAGISDLKVEDAELLRISKRAVSLGRQIDQIDLKLRRIRNNHCWLKRAVQQMDLDFDDDDLPDCKMDSEQVAGLQRKLKELRSQLRAHLARPLLPSHSALISPRFPAFVLPPPPLTC